MNQPDQPQVEETSTSPPPNSKLPRCTHLMPVPKDSPPGTKRKPCGDPAPAVIRVKGRVSFVEAPVCLPHKAAHEQNAASMRVGGGKSLRRSA